MGFFDSLVTGLNSLAKDSAILQGYRSLKPPEDIRKLAYDERAMDSQEFEQVMKVLDNAKEAFNSETRLSVLRLLARYAVAKRKVKALQECKPFMRRRELTSYARASDRTELADVGAVLDALARTAKDDNEAKEFAELADCAEEILNR